MLGQLIAGGHSIIAGDWAMPMSKPTNPAKIVLLGIFVMGLLTVIVFSFIPMTKSYPAYAIDPTTGPAWWTGLSLGMGVWIVSMISRL